MTATQPTILDTVRAGRPLTVPFIDTHGHFGTWADTVIPASTDYAANIAEMDRYGCDMAWLSTAMPGYSADIAPKNDLVFDFADKHPDRIIPYCTLSSHTPERNPGELRRCLARGRCVGVKMHVYQQPGYTMRSPMMQPILEILNERRLVYINHCFDNRVDLEWALERYPEVTFLNGHFHPGFRAITEKFPNMKVCTCAAMGYRDMEKTIRSGFASEAWLAGSDFSLFQLGFGIGAIAYADMPEQDKVNILGANAVRLMERMAWFDESLLTRRKGNT